MYSKDIVLSSQLNSDYIIIKSRSEDIKYRGKNHLVYDYNGRIVKLESATVWYSQDGNYMEPRSYDDICDTICTIS